MMPYIIGDADSIPSEYAAYRDLVKGCPVNEEELGRVGFLSISETFVEMSKSQRRGGVHVEKHPTLSWGGGGGGAWGGTKGGLFMASTVDSSCAVWDVNVEVPGEGGDCSHLENELGTPYLLKSGELIWMTDSTPHASMPLAEAQCRQWFRLVTSEVDIWYSKYSTHNRLGVKPNCMILEMDKFAA